jgi:hypothetical protein
MSRKVNLTELIQGMSKKAEKVEKKPEVKVEDKTVKSAEEENTKSTVSTSKTPKTSVNNEEFKKLLSEIYDADKNEPEPVKVEQKTAGFDYETIIPAIINNQFNEKYAALINSVKDIITDNMLK